MLNQLPSMIMALMMAKVMLNDIPHMLERQELIDKYGSWAVGRAEAVCPKGDMECIEKEAARLQMTQLKELV